MVCNKLKGSSNKGQACNLKKQNKQKKTKTKIVEVGLLASRLRSRT